MNEREANEIIRQLGGNKFKAMTGARDFVYGPQGLSFKIGRNAKRVSGVTIDLDPTDTYAVSFWRISKGSSKLISSHSLIFCDQIQGLFERETGLLVKL